MALGLGFGLDLGFERLGVDFGPGFDRTDFCFGLHFEKMGYYLGSQGWRVSCPLVVMGYWLKDL